MIAGSWPSAGESKLERRSSPVRSLVKERNASLPFAKVIICSALGIAIAPTLPRWRPSLTMLRSNTYSSGPVSNRSECDVSPIRVVIRQDKP